MGGSWSYIKYEPAISMWEDMKAKFCDEYLSPYFRAKYLPQSQCGTFQVEANTKNSHAISCPQCTFEQSTFRQGKELFEKLMKGVQDSIAHEVCLARHHHHLCSMPPQAPKTHESHRRDFTEPNCDTKLYPIL